MDRDNLVALLLCLLMIGSSFQFNYLPSWFSKGFTVFCNLIGWYGFFYMIGYIGKGIAK